MKKKTVLIRVALAFGVGVSVFLLSVLVVWQQSPKFFMTNAVIDYWCTESLRTVDEQLADYLEKNGALPQSLRELEPALKDNHFRNSNVKMIKKGVPIDGWGRPLLYEVHGTSYTLQSYGRDGVPGGTQLDRDLIPSSRSLGWSNEIRANPPRPSLHQLLLELPSKWMILACALSGVVAFILSLFVIRPDSIVQMNKKRFVIKICVLIFASVFFALNIMGLHVPSGH